MLQYYVQIRVLPITIIWVEEIEIEGGTANILKSASPFEYLVELHNNEIYQDT